MQRQTKIWREPCREESRGGDDGVSGRGEAAVTDEYEKDDWGSDNA